MAGAFGGATTMTSRPGQRSDEWAAVRDRGRRFSVQGRFLGSGHAVRAVAAPVPDACFSPVLHGWDDPPPPPTCDGSTRPLCTNPWGGQPAHHPRACPFVRKYQPAHPRSLRSDPQQSDDAWGGGGGGLAFVEAAHSVQSRFGDCGLAFAPIRC